MSYQPPQMYRYRDPGSPPQAPALAVFFQEDAQINHAVTAERGVQTYDNVLIAYVAPMGQPKSNAACEIERTLPDGTVIVNRANAAKYAEQIKLYKAGADAEAQGTPLKDLIGMTPAVIMNLKTIGIHTLEMLADCPDSTNQNLMGFWDLRDRAKKHIQARLDAAPTVRLEAAIAEKDNQIASLQRQLDELAAAVAEQAPKRGPGRPPKVHEAEAA